MDGVRRALGAGQAANSRTKTPEKAKISSAPRRWPQAHGSPQGFRRHRLCLANGIPMEGVAEKGIRECQLHPQIFFGMETEGSVFAPLAEGAGGVRRNGRNRVVLAKHRWSYGKSPFSAGGRRGKSDGSGKKMGPSEIFSSTGMESRCR